MTKAERQALVLRARWNECKSLEPSLDHGDDRAIHRFRLACKRLRYSIELFRDEPLADCAEGLAAVTDALGCVHDCDVLARRAGRLSAQSVARRAINHRADCLHRAIAQWRELARTLEAKLR